MKRKIFSGTDLFLILPLLAAALLAILLPGIKKDGARHAVIVLDGETAADVNLDALTGPERHTFGEVEIEFSPEGARVLASPCPDKICVRTGLLTKNGDTAACVPERIVVKIVTEKNDIDAIAY
ncbi:MAG: NusG domain II-containing protein [Clostridia bacterium]|nr:NusG domain II-containing protein [Clostridia bacterium]